MEKNTSWGHPRNPGYIPGDPWYQCDRCGFDYRQSEVRKQWDNLMVCEKCWEPRHPQDFVKGVKDHQAVTDPRPAPDIALSNTVVKTAASRGDLSLEVDDVTYIADGDSIGITLNNDLVQWTFVDGTPIGTTLALNDALQGDVAVDNEVYQSDDGSTYYLSNGDVTVGSL